MYDVVHVEPILIRLCISWIAKNGNAIFVSESMNVSTKYKLIVLIDYLFKWLFLSLVPDEFQYDPVTKSYGDVTRRPEVKSSTIEFIAPSEYMVSENSKLQNLSHSRNMI